MQFQDPLRAGSEQEWTVPVLPQSSKDVTLEDAGLQQLALRARL